MKRTERKCYKALYFDLSIKALKRYFSRKNPKSAYQKIRNYFIECNFSHEQYSGYHSKYKTTDLEVFQVIQKMRRSLPWLERCLNHFEVTDVGENHDLMILFQDKEMEVE